MQKYVIYLMLLALLLPLCFLASGCDEEEIVLENEIVEELQQQGGVKDFLARIQEMLQDLMLSAPRISHDRNLRIIDQAVDMYKLVEGKDPRAIGTDEEAGTLVGDGYLDSPPRIPMGLKDEEGEWSQYTLKGDPLRAWPVGDWGGYRNDDRF